MFIGEYRHTVDQKGRLAIPVKFRDQLKTAIVTRGLDNCLFLFTQKDWQDQVGKISKLPEFQAKSRAYSRLMLAGAMDVVLDTQGRIIIPDYLRRYAGLKKKAVVAGLNNRLEIWDAEAWDHYQAQAEKENVEIAESLAGLGL
ncbi:MAG: division/cell wall cluster transcriptional repressor MraZ [Candidatus Komeilibacteria bacterium]|nr:division/cell wall cluster transcriptional repressor MraZ [Candidatus Komeilibacteria bacterium]